jgi:protein transport protein SEC23
MSDAFIELEETDGIRLSWNVWPNSRIEATKAVIPFGALYTPLKPLPNMVVVPYPPVQCKQCSAALNPHCQADYTAKLWICPFCHSRNHFPGHYHGMSESNLPAELFPNYSTIEYTLPAHTPPQPPAYVFVVDTALSEDELGACRTALTQALQMIPEYAQVGLVTYGTHVQVYELGFTECSKSYVFKGSKEYTPAQVAQQLGIVGSVRSGPPGQPGAGGAAAVAQAAAAQRRRFILPLGDCEFAITGVLDELQRDAWPTPADVRPSRSTGAALQVAAGLTEAAVSGSTGAARIMLFVGGPTTDGPGQVVAKELLEPIRSHKDLIKETATHFTKAKKFYDGLAAQLVKQGHSLDVFACSLDQVGLFEMKMALEASGGMAVQTDSFHNPVFINSLQRVFAKPGEPGHMGVASNAIFEIIPSRDVKVAGLLGPAAPIEKKTIAVADTAVGMGGTTCWRLAGLDSRTSLAAFFEVVAGSHGKAPDVGAAPQFFLQFVTKYLHENGEFRCRVTTVTRTWTDGSNLGELIAGFDQEAAAVLTARLCTHKMQEEEDFDATRWLDRTLIRLASRFGDYRKDDPTSFQLAHEMSFYPQFMFNLRRSQFVQVFGSSPDETAYCRLYLNRETTADALTMMQPQLLAYTMEGPPQPVLLDVTSIAPASVLVLDSYFYVVVFHGTTVATWRKAEYHLNPEHAAFAQLLEAPLSDATEIVNHRFPVPRLVECDQNGSQARFLLAKLNPSSTYASETGMSSEVIMTDDVSLQVFLDHLKKLAVQS